MVIAALLAIAVAGASASPPISATDLVEVTDISGLAISPDGRTLAFRTARPSIGDNQIHLGWYVVPLDGSAPARAIADGGGPDIDTGVVVSQLPIWSPSSRAFYFRAEHDGQIQLWRAPLDGTDVERVTSDAGNIRALMLAPGDKKLRYDVGATRDDIESAERDASDRGVLIDGSVDVVSDLVRNGWADGHPATMRFSKDWFAHEPLLSASGTHSAYLDLRKDDLASGAAIASASGLTARIDVRDGRQQLHAVDGSGIDRSCTRATCPSDHIRSAVPTGSGTEVLVTTDDADRAQTLWIWTPSTDHWRKLLGSKGLLDGGNMIDNRPCAVTARTVACVAAEPSGPPRLIGINIRTGRKRVLYDPNVSLRSRAWPTDAAHWRTSRGQPVTGQLMLPKTARPAAGYPLVVDYYSCSGFLKGGLGDELPLAPLARAGVATLCINMVKDAGNTETETVHTAIDAIIAGLDTLAGKGLIDRTRIGMAGLSFGSTVTMAVLEHTSLLRAAAISSAQIEPYYYWVNMLPGRDLRDHLKSYFGFGDPDTDHAGWLAHAASNNVKAIRAPLLIQIPESEMRLSIELFSRLSASSTPTEMYAYPDETHIKWVPRHKLAVYQRNLDWFRFWLLGEEDTDPSKADQYQRWHAFSSRPGFALPMQDHAAP